MRCHDKGRAVIQLTLFITLFKLEIIHDHPLFVHSCYCIIMGKKQTVIVLLKDIHRNEDLGSHH